MAKESSKGKKSTKTKSAASSKEGHTPAAEAIREVAKKARVLASNPVVTEMVAATLVAAAAALKDPAKARAMANSASDELQEASAGAAKKTGAFWQMAMDIARRSIDAVGSDAKISTSAKPNKVEAAAKPKAAKKVVKADKPAKAKKAKKAKKA